MKRNGLAKRAFALVLGIGLLAGCKDAVGSQEPDVLEGLGPGIHPVVVVAAKNGTAATVELHLKRIEVESRVASYQGVLEYDPQRLALTGAEVPQGITGAWNETAKGTIRFAGASLEGVPDGPVLVLRFTTQGALRRDAFTLRLEEVISTQEFADLSPQLVTQEQPLFSPVPLK